VQTAVIGAFLLGIVAYAASTTWLLQRESEARSLAEEKTQLALTSAKSEADARSLADEKTKLALDQIEIQRQTATQALEATSTVGENVVQLLQSRPVALDNSKPIQQLRANTLANLERSLLTANNRVQAVAKDTFADVAAKQVLGDLMMKLGRIDKAREAYRSGHQSVADRLKREPDNDRARANLGVMEMRLGDVALDGEGDARTAKTHYLEARRLREQVFREPKTNPYPPLEAKRNLSHDDVRAGRAYLALGQPEQARSYFAEALAYRLEWSNAEPQSNEARSYIAEAHMWLGTTAWHLGDAAAVAKHFGVALALAEKLVKAARPDYVPYRIDLADVHGAHGDALVRLGQRADARKSYQKSLDIIDGLLKQQPGDMSHQPKWALAHERLGIVHDLLTQPADAKKHHAKAMELRLELWRAEPGNLFRQTGLVVAFARVGDFGNALPQSKRIRERMRKSPVLRLHMARCFAICTTAPKADRKEYVALALAELDGAMGDDYRDARALETDPDLASLRSEPGFQQRIARIKTP
jgi:tetratricopeptide (TPR) repeat protein